MTEKLQPDDRELEQYLEGNSPLSRRYRDASAEASPPDLDETILAQARAELKRAPSLNRLLAPFAVAASLLLGVNLAWNVYQARPMPLEEELRAKPANDDFVPSPPPASEPPAAQKPLAQQPPIPKLERDQLEAEQRAQLAKEAEAQHRAMKAQDSAGIAAPRLEPAPAAREGAPAAAPSAMLAEAAPLSEAQKIDRLIAFVGGLDGAAFIRNGEQHTPAEAARHLQLKREKAGNRVKTADDFIRLCASYSSLSGEAYLIKFGDGRTRTAEDVLREELSRIEAR